MWRVSGSKLLAETLCVSRPNSWGGGLVRSGLSGVFFVSNVLATTGRRRGLEDLVHTFPVTIWAQVLWRGGGAAPF